MAKLGQKLKPGSVTCKVQAPKQYAVWPSFCGNSYTSGIISAYKNKNVYFLGDSHMTKHASYSFLIKCTHKFAQLSLQ